MMHGPVFEGDGRDAPERLADGERGAARGGRAVPAMSPSEAEIRALLNAYCDGLTPATSTAWPSLFRHGGSRSPRGTN
jgi:hypothetical protein